MRRITVALATALLLWIGVPAKAQFVKQGTITRAVNADTTVSADSAHTKKVLFKNASVRHASASLGHPAGQKTTGLSKRESDSLQQVILLRKKF